MKSILFNTEMVRAILDERKTVTRRIAFPNNDLREFHSVKYPNGWWWRGRIYKDWNSLLYYLKKEKSCKYQAGDTLYVRETWCRLDCDLCDGDTLTGEPLKDDCPNENGYCYRYRASHTICGDVTWKPSIHMPKEAARIFLCVNGVTLKRLQDISSQEIEREGIDLTDLQQLGGITRNEYVYSFQNLWNNTIKELDHDKYGWDSNPWVWVIEFERISREEALKNDM